MPPEEIATTNTEPRKFSPQVLVAMAVVALIGLSAWYWYSHATASPATHADFYTKLSMQNNSFAQAEKLSAQMRFAEALPLYQTALLSAANNDQALQIKFLIARMLTQTGAYLQAVPLLKEIVATDDNPRITRARAEAVEEIAGLYARGIRDVNNEIFKDEPFTSLLVANDVEMTLQRLHEYAISLFPLAIAEIWIAQSYAYQLPNSNEKSSLSAEIIQEHKAKIAQLFAAADSDIVTMRKDGSMGADLRYALLMRAIVTGILVRKGDTSFGDARSQFTDALNAYAEAEPGIDCIARYHYALFFAQTYGAAQTSDIHALLQPLSGDVYAQSNGCRFLQSARSSAYLRQFPILLADIDPDFKKFLMTIGWTAVDFSS